MDSCRGTLQGGTGSLSTFPSHTECFWGLSGLSSTREADVIGGGLFGLGDLVVGRPQLEDVLFLPSQRERLVHEYYYN